MCNHVISKNFGCSHSATAQRISNYKLRATAWRERSRQDREEKEGREAGGREGMGREEKEAEAERKGWGRGGRASGKRRRELCRGTNN